MKSWIFLGVGRSHGKEGKHVVTPLLVRKIYADLGVY
jgi:hypothetical protein